MEGQEEREGKKEKEGFRVWSHQWVAWETPERESLFSKSSSEY